MQKTNISDIEIEKIIVHDVPRHLKSDTSTEVEYSERVSSLSSELKLFFKNKLIEALAGSKSFQVCFEEGTTSPLPKLIIDSLTADEKLFVLNSQKIAKHLYDIQTGANPSGILVALSIKYNGVPLLGIMKLERDEGARLKKNDKAHTIDIESVRDLMLTKRTKVFKVGLFFNRSEFNVNFDGYVNDTQASYYGGTGIANFFLKEFLGCIMFGDTRALTKNFFEASKEFITSIDDPIKKTKYYNDLLSYITKNSNHVNPREFALDYLETNDRQIFENFIKEKNVPFQSIPKDNELIRGQIKKMVMEFENGISIVSAAGKIEDKVSLSEAEDGKVKAEFTSKLKKVTS